MNAYDFVLICAGQRTTRKIIAHGTVQATQIGLRMLPQISAPLSIICKPIKLS